MLTEGGLDPALKALARRSAIPVELDVRIGPRLPERVEVAAYYLVSEALTNAAKHSEASVVHVQVAAGERDVLLAIRDDGIGGADPSQGSGLIGLSDRVEALGGTIEISSPAGGGTSLASPCRSFQSPTGEWEPPRSDRVRGFLPCGAVVAGQGPNNSPAWVHGSRHLRARTVGGLNGSAQHFLDSRRLWWRVGMKVVTGDVNEIWVRFAGPSCPKPTPR